MKSPNRRVKTEESSEMARKRRRETDAIPTNDDTLEIARLIRDVPPTHYTFRVDNFSLLQQILSKTGLDKYESGTFEAGGYNWRLSLYPSGNKKRNGEEHISLYLMMAETNTLPLGWEVNAIFTFFVYDQIRDKYLTIQDGRVRRFHAMKTEWGFSQLISLTTFSDASRGYLIDDCCVFGSEVFIIKCEGKGERLFIMKEPKGICTWKIEKFSGLKEQVLYSQVFTVGERQWKLTLYPQGDSGETGKSLSLYLCLNDYSNLRPGWKLYVEFKLSIRDQVHGNHSEHTTYTWFCASEPDLGWGFPEFMLLKDLNDASKGFLVNDTLIIEGEIILLSVVEDFS